jgi:hypothetical protein
LTFNKNNGTKNGDKPDKAARPWGKLDVFFEGGDITLSSASTKPNTWRPRL